MKIQRVAGSRLYKVESVEESAADFGLKDFEPRKGMIYTRVRAISARVNRNLDGFESDELKRAYESFIGKPVFVDHHNDDPSRTRGIIVGAAYREDGDDRYIELFIEVDSRAFPLLAKEIELGNIDSVSMGCNVDYTICSFCGNEAVEESDFCEHILFNKGQTLIRVNEDGQDEEVLVYEVCKGVSFFEISFVFDPADETAVASGVYMAKVAKRRKRALERRQREVTRPGVVDTLREGGPCPECGSKEFDQIECEWCGHLGTIEQLDDPDLSKTKEFDETREQEAEKSRGPSPTRQRPTQASMGRRSSMRRRADRANDGAHLMEQIQWEYEDEGLPFDLRLTGEVSRENGKDWYEIVDGMNTINYITDDGQGGVIVDDTKGKYASRNDRRERGGKMTNKRPSLKASLQRRRRQKRAEEYGVQEQPFEDGEQIADTPTPEQGFSTDAEREEPTSIDVTDLDAPLPSDVDMGPDEVDDVTDFEEQGTGNSTPAVTSRRRARAAAARRRAQARRKRAEVEHSDAEAAEPDVRGDVEVPTGNVTDEEAQASQYNADDYEGEAVKNSEMDLSTDHNWVPGEKASSMQAMALTDAYIEQGLIQADQKFAKFAEFEKMTASQVQDRMDLLEQVKTANKSQKRASRSAVPVRAQSSQNSAPSFGRAPRTAGSNTTDDAMIFIN